MSVIYTGETKVIKQEIDNLIQQGLKISGEYVKTYRLYCSDKKLLMSVEKRQRCFEGANYTARLYNVDFDDEISLKPDWKMKNLYSSIKPFFNERYSLKPIVHIDFTVKEAKQEVASYLGCKDSKASVVYRLLMDLVYNLKKAKCPAEVVEQVIFYFDKPNSKHEFKGDFETLNHDNKLVEYKTQLKDTWFFAGENFSHSFTPIDEESEEIFDMVRNALKNQKQHVK